MADGCAGQGLPALPHSALHVPVGMAGRSESRTTDFQPRQGAPGGNRCPQRQGESRGGHLSLHWLRPVDHLSHARNMRDGQSSSSGIAWEVSSLQRPPQSRIHIARSFHWSSRPFPPPSSSAHPSKARLPHLSLPCTQTSQKSLDRRSRPSYWSLVRLPQVKRLGKPFNLHREGVLVSFLHLGRFFMTY